jgi:hypothetical protein
MWSNGFYVFKNSFGDSCPLRCKYDQLKSLLYSDVNFIFTFNLLT